MTPGSFVTPSFDGIPLHYTVHGVAGAPAVVLIHGWSCDQTFWSAQIPVFTERFRVVTLDLAGHGRSRAAASDRVWSIESFARDVEAVADAAGVNAFAIIGHSMGGPVAIETAVRLGQRCRLLLGVDTFNEATFYRRRPAAEIAARRGIFELDFAAAIMAMVERITAPELDRDAAHWIATAMSRTDAPTALAALEALLAWDIDERWPLVAVPTETINSALLARRNDVIALDRLRVHEIEDAGHFLMLENPAAFNPVALTILERHLTPLTTDAAETSGTVGRPRVSPPLKRRESGPAGRR